MDLVTIPYIPYQFLTSLCHTIYAPKLFSDVKDYVCLLVILGAGTL
jgi:hypothetical protein